MAKITLLDMVQRILNDMDSDEVNSIEDTVEAQQVASIVRDVYEEMISNRNWPHLRKLVQLESANDLSKPNYLRLPEHTKELSFVKYEVQKHDTDRIYFKELKYKQPDDFLRMVSGRNSDDLNVSTVYDFSGSRLLVQNNFAPSYWTSFDDLHLVTDSYDKLVDDTLQGSKTQAMAYIESPWVHADDAVPNLPTEAFAALLAEAKSSAFFVLKQMVNTKEEQKAARQQRWLSQKAWRAKGGVQFPNYGRKGRR